MIGYEIEIRIAKMQRLIREAQSDLAKAATAIEIASKTPAGAEEKRSHTIAGCAICCTCRCPSLHTCAETCQTRGAET